MDDPGPYDYDAYVWTTVNSASDEYAVQDLSGSPTIGSVTVTAVANDVPVDPCYPPGSCPTYLRLTVNGVASPDQLLWTAYTEVSHTWTTNPATGLAWTAAEVDALQAGVRHVASNEQLRVTQLFVTVNLGRRVTYAYHGLG